MLLKLSTRRGFTLIELLVVIAIIAILAAILFPVFAQAKEAAKISSGLSNAKQMATGFHMYEGDSDDTMPLNGIGANLITSSGAALSEWQNATYPYVKNEGVYRVLGDTTRNRRYDASELNACRNDISRGFNTTAATSFLANYTLTTLQQQSGGQYTRNGISATAVTAPANYIQLMNGNRGPVGGAFLSQRVGFLPDHNGDVCSMWYAVYSMPVEAGIGYITNPNNVADISTAPHHKRGFFTVFADGHAKFQNVSGPNAAGQLEGKMPYCRYGEIDSDNQACRDKGQKWNYLDL